MIDKSAYILKISQANPVELVVINFELVLEYLAVPDIPKAKEGLEQLIQSLNFDISFAQDFHDIYSYCYKLLCDVQFSKDEEKTSQAIAEVTELLQPLLDGWRHTAESPEGKSVAAGQTAPVVYSGLTYGRDGAAEEYIDEDKDRGYIV